MIRPALAMLAALWMLLGTSVSTARADDLKDGRAALAAGQYDQALKSFAKAAEAGLAEGRAGEGQVWLKRRQYAKAYEAFTLAQKMDGGLALAYWGQGEVLRHDGKCSEAIPLFQRAVELDRKFPEAQMSLGACLVESKQLGPAIEVLSVGLKWGPKWRPRFLVALGDAELARDSLRAANVYYTQAREEAPGDPAPRRALGDFYLIKRGIGELAIPEYAAAVAMDSNDVELRYSLAQGLYYAQRYNEALEQYKWVVDHDPEFAPGQLGLGNLYFLSGPADPRRYADAKAPLEQYTQLSPEDAKGWSLLGRTYYFLKQRDDALGALEKSVQLGAVSKETYTILGRLYAEKKSWDRALASFEKGEPSGRDLFIIAQVYGFQGQAARAESVYTAIIEKDSTAADARFAMNQMGMLRFRAQDYAGAVGWFGRRIALDPSNDEAYYYAGLSYKEMKQYPEALGALRQAVALADGKSDRHFWLGILYAQQDSTEQATRELTRSLELDSTGTFAGVAYRQLGYYQLLQHVWGDAGRLLERSVGLNDKDVQAWVWLGQAYQNSGNRTRAVECYRKALALDPKQADALKGIQTLGAGAPR